MKVVLAKRAARDIRAIEAYVRNENPQAAKDTIAAMAAAIETLTLHPNSGRKVTAHGVRRFPVPRTPYLAYYRIAGEEVLILHVRDGRRRPYTP
jgi:addiction module RelE/StbE family toxin